MANVIATQTTATKAIVGSVISGVVSALSALVADLTGDADWSNPGTYISIVLAGLVGAGLVGAGVYQTTNKVKPLG